MEAEIRDLCKFVEVLEFAQETGSIESLLCRLKSFERWEEGNIVFFCTDPEEIDFLLVTKSQKIRGGIVYHRHSNTWGTHT